MERIAFSLSFAAASNKLQANFDPKEGAKIPDRPAFDSELAIKGWTGFYLDETAIAQFLEQAGVLAATPGAEPLAAIVGERRDGSLKLDVSLDKMNVLLTLVAPQGGKSMADEVRPAMQAQGIVFGIQEEALAATLAAGQGEQVLIAVGIPPQEGESAHFDSLIEALRAAHGHVEGEVAEDAAIDYHDLGNLLIIHAGTPLMRRTPAVLGVPGTDVFGISVPPKPVSDPPFSANLKGSAPAANDSNELVALIDGQPVPGSDGVDVNPLVEADQIDIETGNVKFDGTVQVKGDVKAGMHIHARGDVVIGGTLEAAEIIAGGNVVVQGGIVGRADVQTGAQGGGVETATIRCEGSVQAKFVEHGVVEARGDILIERAVRQSELSAGHNVTVGASGSGHIMGGRVRAGLTVRTGTLGASSETPTHIQVGFDPYLNREKVSTEAQRKKKLEDFAKIRQLLDFLDHHPAKGEGGVREKAEHTLAAIEGDIHTLDATLLQLNAQMEVNDGAMVVVSKHVHAGVVIHIGQKHWEARDDGSGGSWRLDEHGEIISDWVS
ncbi:DUF342 domain-containing protein [Chitinimonas sp. BJB300]|uniref:DUF342 domain-containing protein n=1 Tax=Chitinimonas sp. BJB300 TaxID=1559339 RepID=UPI000C0FAEA5|nr:FapA family protein [Chitinimonas sp. BJB300]PHV13158.1 hypothetical protein CSQ89_01810 [Chitinimonas sp. BJB300]TSJ87139.1 DUF342 domain-containing protein [Chitinimonas sp. BJB300]